jgi:hypothetical protein
MRRGGEHGITPLLVRALMVGIFAALISLAGSAMAARAFASRVLGR